MELVLEFERVQEEHEKMNIEMTLKLQEMMNEITTDNLDDLENEMDKKYIPTSSLFKPFLQRYMKWGKKTCLCTKELLQLQGITHGKEREESLCHMETTILQHFYQEEDDISLATAIEQEVR